MTAAPTLRFTFIDAGRDVVSVEAPCAHTTDLGQGGFRPRPEQKTLQTFGQAV